MSATAVPVHTHRLPSPALQRFAWGVLVYFIAVILWGGLVRASGSGAGCGDHWPLCNGTVMQHSPRVDTMIEFTHRITSGLSFIAVLVLAVWTWIGTPIRMSRARAITLGGLFAVLLVWVGLVGASPVFTPALGVISSIVVIAFLVGLVICIWPGIVHGHLARAAAAAAVTFTVIEAALGAFLVKLGLTAQSRSPLRAPYLALHLTNTLLLLAAITLAAHFLGRHSGTMPDKVRMTAPFVGIASLAIVLVVGVTGSLAALGDTLFPASSLGTAFAQDLPSASEWLVRWRWTHPAVAFLSSVFLIWLLVRAAQRRSHWDNRALSALVLILLALQYVLGVLDVAFLAPVWLQILHLLGADVLWAAIVVLAARLTIEPAE